MNPNQLEIVTPEEMGVPSTAISAYFEKLADKQLCVHAVLMLRHGKIIAEAYAPPFHAERQHRMYSVSKSFVAAGVGLALGEGLLKLEDRVADYFPEALPDDPDPRITAATVRDLLMMACPNNSSMYREKDLDWVKPFFHAKPTHAPGSLFIYNTGATVVLNALVEKLSGQILTDFLRTRLFDPIGVSADVRCVLRPEGGCWGGSGILCTARDLARVALVFLNGGRWGNRQILPEGFVREATTAQIPNLTGSVKPERRYGYGYQIWMTRQNGFAMLGMGGQMALGVPDKNFLLVTLADTQLTDNGDVMLADAFWDCVHPHLTANALPSNPDGVKFLQHQCQSLAIPLPAGRKTSARSNEIHGHTYRLDENPMGITSLRLEFEQTCCRMHYQNATGAHTLTFGLGHYHSGQFPEKHYYGSQIGKPLGRGYECLAAAGWLDDRTLLGTVYITDDYLGTLTMQLVFDGNHVSIHMIKVAEWFLNEYQGFAYGTRS